MFDKARQTTIQRLWQLRDSRIARTVNPIDHDPSVHYWDDAGYMFRRFPRYFDSLLDVGIGSGWLGATVQAVYGITADGVEAYKPYIQKAQRFYGKIWEMDIDKSIETIPQKSYAIVTCLNTIEHFSDPAKVVAHLERIARQAVFVSSVNFHQPSVAWDGNQHQLHKSLFTAQDMKRLGYTVRGSGTLHDYIGRLARVVPMLDSGYLAYKYMEEEHAKA